MVTKNKGRFLNSRMCEEVNQLVEQLVQQRMASSHLDHAAAASGTKKDIVDEKVDPEIFAKIVRAVRFAGECVGAFVGGVGKGLVGSLPKCSVM
ncbi:hypothetical protein BaRGS_00016799 [Batillaria attramentaria]|uniref:Uncharacterized protein n=1 Tax=Batillaria attramentaria TaxID=370345 RepID=A0ABD0KXS9_9CAEN